jgi:tetratricopeptide (TPR) repeat protein
LQAISKAAAELKRWPEAIEFARQQVHLAQGATATDERPDLDLFLLLVGGYRKLLEGLIATGQTNQARTTWEEMVRLVAWSDPLSVNDEGCLFLSQTAKQLAVGGNDLDPGAVLAPGLADRRAKLQTEPAALKVQIDLRRGYRVAGLIHEKSARFAAAVEAFDEVVAVAPAPAESSDRQAKSERHLIYGALLGRAICLDALGRESESEAAWRGVYDFTGAPPDGFYWMRVTNLARNGQPEQAVRLAEEKLQSSDGGWQRYDAARVYATASASSVLAPARKEVLARRAVDLLVSAQAVGLSNDPKLLERAKADVELDAIRGRGDFMKWLADLEANKPAE